MFVKAEGLIPRGVAHDACSIAVSLFMSRAAGSRIWMWTGTSSSIIMGATGEGARPRHRVVVRAAQEQLKRDSVRRLLRPQCWIGRVIQRLVPSAERIEFTNSGTEAIMLGVPSRPGLHRQEEARPVSVSLRRGLRCGHGRLQENLSRYPFPGAFFPSAVEDTVVLPMNEEAVLEEALRKPGCGRGDGGAAGASSGSSESNLLFIRP